MQKLVYVMFLLLFTSSILLSQTNKIKISSIVVEGNNKSSASSIRLNAGLKVGDEINMDDVQQGIHNLWQLELFSDVQIYATNQTVDGIDLLIRVKEYPKLREKTIKGAKKISEKDIEEVLGAYRSMIVSPFRYAKMEKSVLKKYHEEGYLLASVSFDTTSAGEGMVDLTINIDEGKEVQVESIRFHGQVDFDEDDLRGAMDDIKEDRWWRSADFNPKKYEDDKGKIVQYMKGNGFRDAEIERDSVSYNEDKSDLFLDIWIAEGNKYYFGDISFEGQTLFSAEELKATLDLAKGDLYNQKKYDEGVRDRLQKLYYNEGYLFAQIQPVELPVSSDTLDINFRILEGHVVHVKEMQITGNTKTHEKVIRREFRLHPGDKFNSAKLERSVRDVMILNYFANVVPDVRLIENDDQNVNLLVDVEEKSTDMANMSAGYSQRDRVIFSLGLAFNNFSLQHPLSGGDGQRLSIDAQYGKIYRSYSLSFTEPWLFNTPTLGGFSIFRTLSGGGYYPWNREDTGGTLRLGRRFHWPDNYFRGDWIFRYAQTRITDITDEDLLSRYSYYQKGKTSQVSLSQIISRDSRNSAEFPTHGSVNSLMTELSGGPLGGDQEYIKSVFSSEWYLPLPYGLVLYSNNKYGVIEPLTANSVILFGDYFYIGGSGLGFAEGLRGYEDGQVGPVTSSGSPIGGKAMVKNTLELRFPIAPNPTIYGLFFAEGGNAWEELGQISPFDLRRSVGLGVRLFMPMIGIIGLDFGYGFDYYDVYGRRSGKWKIHFQFGRF